MKYASFAFALCFLASDLASRPALAATATASFSVSATISASCQVSAPASAYGAYTAVMANAASPASVTCTSPTPYSVSYRTELAPSVTVTTWKTAASASDTPGHALLPDSAHPGIWGRTVGAGNEAGTGSGSSQTRDGYYRTAWSHCIATGAFADSVTVTITY
jgi:spore coat protein U-like protein